MRVTSTLLLLFALGLAGCGDDDNEARPVPAECQTPPADHLEVVPGSCVWSWKDITRSEWVCCEFAHVGRKECNNTNKQCRQSCDHDWSGAILVCPNIVSPPRA